MITVYGNKETNFTHNGLAVLSDCISAPITEELNGRYEVVLECPIDIRGKWKNLVEDNILKVDGQLFRIYHKSTTLTSRKVNARHIFYDMLDNLVNEIDIRGLSGVNALTRVMSNLAYPSQFTYSSDIYTTNNIYLDDSSGDILDMNPVDVIINLVNIYKGELSRDNFNFKMLSSIGTDRGVLISYGKNIQGIEETLDLDSVCTRLKPIGKDGLMITETFVNSSYINSYANPKIKVVQFNDISDESELRAAGIQYFIDSKCDIPPFNYLVDFVELSKTDEYKHYAVLERVYLGDTVTIRHKKLNISMKAKVIRTVKDPITNKLTKVELGSFKPDLSSTIGSAITDVKKDIVKVTTAYQKAIDNATALITGSNGGNVVIRQDSNKKPYEILIMDTTDVMTAENVWRWNLGGFGHSSTGINGPYETAITQDGHIVASFITALEINGQQITAGIIKSKTNKWIFDLDTEHINLGDKLIFDGTNLSFGTGVTLAWGQVSGTPSIPSQYTNGMALSAIQSTYIDAQNVWTIAVKAQNIQGGTIEGCTIKTVANAGNGNYGLILREQYLDAVDTIGTSILGLGWSGVTPFLRIGLDNGYDFKISNSGGISTIKCSANGTNVTGPIDFSAATVTGLGNVTIVAKFG